MKIIDNECLTYTCKHEIIGQSTRHLILRDIVLHLTSGGNERGLNTCLYQQCRYLPQHIRTNTTTLSLLTLVFMFRSDPPQEWPCTNSQPYAVWIKAHTQRLFKTVLSPGDATNFLMSFYFSTAYPPDCALDVPYDEREYGKTLKISNQPRTWQTISVYGRRDWAKQGPGTPWDNPVSDVLPPFTIFMK